MTDPDGLKLWLYFITCWVTFWGVAGGVVCYKLGRPAWKGAVLGAILAPVGILLALLTHDDGEQRNELPLNAAESAAKNRSLREPDRPSR